MLKIYCNYRGENMKQAIMALDGGGSNLRMILVDKDTEKELYFREIDSGTNL